MKFVLLSSDIFLFIFIFILIGCFIVLLRNPHSRAKWQYIFKSRIGMCSFIIILTYILIGFVDSIHFRKMIQPASQVHVSPQKLYYSSTVYSALDAILNYPEKRTEKTYSAPFSIISYTKENKQDQQGKIYRDFTKLKYAGAHLTLENKIYIDILYQSLIAILKGSAFAGFFILLHRLFFYRSASPYPWRTAYITIAVTFSILSWFLHVGALYHILGTNKVGSDVLYACLKGIRTGLLIGTLATLVMMPFAIILGMSAGYFKGWVDDVIQYLYTTLSSVPSILIISASVLMFQVWIDLHPHYFETSLEKGDAKFIVLCFILGVTGCTTLCRLLRAETLKISQLDYIRAAHGFAVSPIKILYRHILPNITHIILITFVLDFSALILAEAILSYVGIGVDSSLFSWGNIISSGRAELSKDPVIWWNLSGAFIFMFILVLASNLFSDLVTEAFNPKSIIH